MITHWRHFSVALFMSDYCGDPFSSFSTGGVHGTPARRWHTRLRLLHDAAAGQPAGTHWRLCVPGAGETHDGGGGGLRGDALVWGGPTPRPYRPQQTGYLLHWTPLEKWQVPGGLRSSPFTCWIFHRKCKNVAVIYVITPHWHDTGSWNSSSCKTRTYLFYIANIMGADVLATQGATASATMIFIVLNWNYSVPAC